MKVKQLIEILNTMPPNAEMGIVYDGAARMDLGCCYESNNKNVLVTGSDECVFHKEDLPKSGKTIEEISIHSNFWNRII